MQSGCVWLHINTLSRVTLSCQILCYKYKGFTCSYWHIRLSQLFLKEIISITSCSSAPQGCNLYSSVPSLLFIPFQLNILKKPMEINKHTHNIVSKWKSETLHSMGITQDFTWAIVYSYFMPHVLQSSFCSIPHRTKWVSLLFSLHSSFKTFFFLNEVMPGP